MAFFSFRPSFGSTIVNRYFSDDESHYSLGGAAAASRDVDDGSSDEGGIVIYLGDDDEEDDHRAVTSTSLQSHTDHVEVAVAAAAATTTTAPPPPSSRLSSYFMAGLPLLGSTASEMLTMESESDGLTIVSSVSSSADQQARSEAIAQQLPLTIFSTSPAVAGSESSSISLHTTESVYRPVDPRAWMDLSSSSPPAASLRHSLTSLHLSPVPSSVADTITLGGNGGSHSSLTTVPSVLMIPNGNNNNNNNNSDAAAAVVEVARVWYATMQTEDEWDAFRTRILNILTALEDNEEGYDPDALLAALIAREEELIWDRATHDLLRQRRTMQKYALGLLTTVFPLAGIAWLTTRPRV